MEDIVGALVILGTRVRCGRALQNWLTALGTRRVILCGVAFVRSCRYILPEMVLRVKIISVAEQREVKDLSI